MNETTEPQVCRAVPIEEALRYAISLGELLRQMHRLGTVYGRLDRKEIIWDNHSVKLAQRDGVGSGAYLAPEQVRGEPADMRSDIFSFGAIVYEVMSGQKAFPAEDPEERNRQILEAAPAPAEGIPEGIAALLRGCLEKDRDLRWQRMGPILIDLKLAHTALGQAQSASEWKERALAVRSHIAGHGQQLTAQQELIESLTVELRDSMQRIEQMLVGLQESIGGLQKGAQLNAKAIEGLQVAGAQTDEVVEHVVEAFGMMHRSMVEHGDPKVLLGSRNGS